MNHNFIDEVKEKSTEESSENWKRERKSCKNLIVMKRACEIYVGFQKLFTNFFLDRSCNIFAINAFLLLWGRSNSSKISSHVLIFLHGYVLLRRINLYIMF